MYKIQRGAFANLPSLSIHFSIAALFFVLLFRVDAAAAAARSISLFDAFELHFYIAILNLYLLNVVWGACVCLCVSVEYCMCTLCVLHICNLVLSCPFRVNWIRVFVSWNEVICLGIMTSVCVYGWIIWLYVIWRNQFTMLKYIIIIAGCFRFVVNGQNYLKSGVRE